jgi:hypothetical protein
MTKHDLYQMYKAETGKNPDMQYSFSNQCPNCDEEVDVDVDVYLSEFEYFTWMETKFLELLEQNKSRFCKPNMETKLKGFHL